MLNAGASGSISVWVMVNGSSVTGRQDDQSNVGSNKDTGLYHWDWSCVCYCVRYSNGSGRCSTFLFDVVGSIMGTGSCVVSACGSL